MPVKRRLSKARMRPEAEAEFWSDFFDFGGFLLAGWEQVLGLPPAASPQERQAAERSAEVVEAARDAWRRLGADYLAGGLGPAGRTFPKRGAWALAEFGEPG